jgi:hypothetical protein
MTEKYLSPEQVVEMLPGLTKGGLAQRRYLGLAPTYIKPSPKVVLYAESEIIAWLKASEQTKTGQLVR